MLKILLISLITISLTTTSSSNLKKIIKSSQNLSLKIKNLKKELKNSSFLKNFDFDLKNFLIDKYFENIEDSENLEYLMDENLIKNFFENFKEKMIKELLGFYGIEEEGNKEYIDTMKESPKKYGLTFNAFKILIE